ncbi:MAG: hypothetical protein RR228_03985 [Bacilli bacterium]
MTNDPKLLNSPSVEVIFDKQWYYNLTDTVKYLFKKDTISILNEILNNKEIEIHKMRRRNDENYITIDYLDTYNLIKVLLIYNSPKIKDIKLWFASIILERINEIVYPEIALDRLKTINAKKGNQYKYIFQKKENPIDIEVLTNQEILDEEISIK